MSTRPQQTPERDAARFFDRVSGTYRDKYGTRSPFHHYFFNERLEKAVRGLDLADRDLLDIGAGTGNLYDHLLERFPTMRFFATDVSGGMLSQSAIPAERRFVGHAYDHRLPVQRFDAIFMLGVTTYLDDAELDRNLAFIARSLKPGGVAVITFTNKHGLDTIMRVMLRPLMRLMGRRDKVLSSGLRTHLHSMKGATAHVKRHLEIQRWDLLNHTVFPFGLLLPRLSLWLAHRMDRARGNPAWLRSMSSDLMVRASPHRGGPATEA